MINNNAQYQIYKTTIMKNCIKKKTNYMISISKQRYEFLYKEVATI